MRRIVWAIFSSMVGVLISMTDANVFFNVTIQIFFWGMVGVGLGITTHLTGRRPTFRVLWRFGEHGELTTLVACLLSDTSPYQTGDEVTIDGAEALLSGQPFASFVRIDRHAAKQVVGTQLEDQYPGCR